MSRPWDFNVKRGNFKSGEWKCAVHLKIELVEAIDGVDVNDGFDAPKIKDKIVLFHHFPSFWLIFYLSNWFF